MPAGKKESRGRIEHEFNKQKLRGTEMPINVFPPREGRTIPGVCSDFVFFLHQKMDLGF